MTVEKLAAEINKLRPQQRQELLRILGVPSLVGEKRGGPKDPFSKVIGKFSGATSGSRQYKDDLYGGDRPL
jgi:hypothetical protein